MPLRQLVEYFNDRLEREHHADYRPFILDKGGVQGLFGPTRIGSLLFPIRKAKETHQVIGQIAQLTVTTHQTPTVQRNKLEILLAKSFGQTDTAESIVNFDRISRSIHMLNYLPQSHRDELLFLDVDPRHILGVKADHGAYFEEVIVKCGLQTQNVTIAMTVDTAYIHFYQALLNGLSNYKKHGYRLMLKFDHRTLHKSAIELIHRAQPDFVSLSVHNLEHVNDPSLQKKIRHLNLQIQANNARSILLNVDDTKAAMLAYEADFDLLQGNYLDRVAMAA